MRDYRDMTGKELHAAAFRFVRGSPSRRQSVEAATLDGAAVTVERLAAQIHHNDLVLEGLRVRNRELQERQRAQETVDVVEREIDAAAARHMAAYPTISKARAVELALEENPALYDRHAAAVQRERGEAPIEAAQRQTAGPRTSLPLATATAEELRANPALTREQAYAAALDKYPNLYEG